MAQFSKVNVEGWRQVSSRIITVVPATVLSPVRGESVSPEYDFLPKPTWRFVFR